MANNRTEMLAGTNYWNELLLLRDRQRDEIKNGVQVIRAADLPQELNQQGLMKWYLHPEIKDTVLSTLMFFEQEIPPASKSGTYQFQGAQVMYIVAGRGYTLIDGVKHHWEAGDVLNLPLRQNGIIVQHVNEHLTEPARFVAAEPNFFACTTVDRGSGFEQLDEAPEYRRRNL